MTEEDITQVLQYYDLGSLRACRRVGRGHVNENWMIDTDRGRYFLKRRHPYLRCSNLIRAQHDLMTYLHTAGFPAPAVVPTQIGQSFLALGGEIYEIHTYIEGEPYDWDQPIHFESAAAVLGRYHCRVTGFEAAPFSRRGELYRPAILTQIVERLIEVWHMQRRPDLAALADRLRAQVEDLVTCYAEIDTLPRLIIHGDYYADNLIFHGDQVAGVVDYDKARWQPRAVELAEAVIYFGSCRPGHLTHLVYPGFLNLERVRRFLNCYSQTATLQPTEICALPHLIRSIWLCVSLRRLMEKDPPPELKLAALREVLELAGWSEAHASEIIEIGLETTMMYGQPVRPTTTCREDSWYCQT